MPIKYGILICIFQKKNYKKKGDWIIEYNENWPHSAIKELTGEKTTPQQAWNSMIHWDINKKDEIEYYK